MKNARSTVRKAGKKGMRGGLATGASFPRDVMATRRHQVAKACIAARAKQEGKTTEQLIAELRELAQKEES